MTEITVAGHLVTDPLSILESYVQEFRKTLEIFDNRVHGDLNVITIEDLDSVDIIGPRFGSTDKQRILDSGRENQRLLEDIPEDAHIRDADPAEKGGLHDQMLALFDSFRDTQIKHAKISKTLHPKRPHLFPILDSQVMKLYDRAAVEAAKRYPQLGHKRMFWAAVRDDVLHNQSQLDELRTAAAQNPTLASAGVDKLSDVRLIDILAWWIAKNDD